MNNEVIDLLVIGGGINGVGIATDAAGRGLSVTLCEQDDLASGTSWKSSKLIHGGLRYLEHYEFKLVKKALAEREILLKKAPHIIQPLTFVLPHNQYLRPAWLIRLGLFFYDHLSKHSLPKAKQINLCHEFGEPLKTNYTKGFCYSDCYVDDARLVILNAMHAKQMGARILTRTKAVATQRHKDWWEINLRNTMTQKDEIHKARVLINASGPWLKQTLKDLHIPFHHPISLVKGSHIVVPKLYEGEQAYILQNQDNRVVFVIPFQQDYNLIGTTDEVFHGDLSHPEIDQAEIHYLCTLVNNYFQKAVTPSDIIWTYAGVRPLKTTGTNPSAISRDYELDLDTHNNMAPLINILGGKLTTYRELAEDVMKRLKPFFPNLKSSWTATTPLPGGDIPHADFNKFYSEFRHQYSWLPETMANHYAHQYGNLAHMLLKGTRSLNDLGEDFSSGLYQHEIEYLIANEWAKTAEDILWRRTKYGLNFSEAATEKLKSFLLRLFD